MNAQFQTIQVLDTAIGFWICEVDGEAFKTKAEADDCCADMLSKSVTPPECFAKKQKATKASLEMNVTPFGALTKRRDR